MVDYPNHEQAWFWIGAMALLSPVGMIIWRKTFNQSEQMAEKEALAQVAAEEAEAAAETEVNEDATTS
jgi:hypothetical protein